MSNLPLYEMIVGGEYVSSASGKTFEVENPATGQIIAYVSEGDKEDIDNAVRVAAKGFASRRAATPLRKGVAVSL